MGFYINKFYIEKRDLYFLIGIGLIYLARAKNYPLPYINYDVVLILSALFFLAKGFILPAHDSIVFIVFFAALFLTFFINFFQILIFIFLAFLFLRILKVI